MSCRIDYYKNRHLLESGQIYLTKNDDLVKLDRMVPGDATKWYVLDYFNGGWLYEDSTIEPSDLDHRLLHDF